MAYYCLELANRLHMVQLAGYYESLSEMPSVYRRDPMAAFELSCDRLPTPPLYAWWVFALAITLGVCAGGSNSEASIARPAMPQFSLESSGAGCSHEITSPSDRQSSSDSAAHLKSALLLNQHQPSSTSQSSTSGSSSLARASVTAMMHTTLNASRDAVIAGWLSGERQASLPTPPRNDLLRPPQAT